MKNPRMRGRRKISLNMGVGGRKPVALRPYCDHVYLALLAPALIVVDAVCVQCVELVPGEYI